VSDDLPFRRLLSVARAVVSELDTASILDRVLEAAIDVCGARYAALGVLDEDRRSLAQFRTIGIDESTARAIGEQPVGRGVLGVLISEPRPLRLRDVGEHPRSYGLPEGHPEMHSFLGVPIMIRGEAWGNLYLAEKIGAAEFTAADEEAAVIVAEWAAAAIHNARLYERSESRREQLEQAVRGLEATRDIAVAISGVAALDRVLELIVKRGRALVDARAVLIMLKERDELVVAASAGYADDMHGRRVPIAGSSSGQVLGLGRPERIVDVGARLRIAPAELGVADAHTALLVPMLHRGQGVGVMAAFDRGDGGAPFTATDERLLYTFAASAANAVAMARSVEADRLRSSMAAADSERKRWARELHDETLQILGGLRVLLASAVRRGDSGRYEAVMREAIEGIEQGIEGLRGIITDLRPAALDELGLKPAIEGLIDRRRGSGLAIVAELELPEIDEPAPMLDPELENAVYRLVQEALTNIVKHAHASQAWVKVIAAADGVTIEVRDDGIGFDPEQQVDGFGLAGMRERVYLAAGKLQIESGASGTRLRIGLPGRGAVFDEDVSPSPARASGSQDPG
jgi:signal transduction histidine kinase